MAEDTGVDVATDIYSEKKTQEEKPLVVSPSKKKALFGPRPTENDDSLNKPAFDPVADLAHYQESWDKYEKGLEENRKIHEAKELENEGKVRITDQEGKVLTAVANPDPTDASSIVERPVDIDYASIKGSGLEYAVLRRVNEDLSVEAQIVQLKKSHDPDSKSVKSLLLEPDRVTKLLEGIEAKVPYTFFVLDPSEDGQSYNLVPSQVDDFSVGLRDMITRASENPITIDEVADVLDPLENVQNRYNKIDKPESGEVSNTRNMPLRLTDNADIVDSKKNRGPHVVFQGERGPQVLVSDGKSEYPLDIEPQLLEGVNEKNPLFVLIRPRVGKVEDRGGKKVMKTQPRTLRIYFPEDEFTSERVGDSPVVELMSMQQENELLKSVKRANSGELPYPNIHITEVDWSRPATTGLRAIVSPEPVPGDNWMEIDRLNSITVADFHTIAEGKFSAKRNDKNKPPVKSAGLFRRN